MYRSESYVEDGSGSFEADQAVSRPRLGINDELVGDRSARIPSSSSSNSSRFHRRCQSQSIKRTSEVKEYVEQSPAQKTSKPDGWIGGPPSPYSPDPMFDERCTDDKEFSYAFTRSNSRSCLGGSAGRESSPYELNVNHSHTDASEEDASLSAQPKSNANTIRFRSVSFCTSVPFSIRVPSSLRMPPAPSIPNRSILESILLNRNIPESYSVLGPKLTRQSDSSDCSSSEDHPPSDNYKRPRLRSLPLPTPAIQVNDIRRKGEERDLSRWAAAENGDGPDEPICLSLKKRKLSLDGHYKCDGEISSTRIDEENTKSSILHSLLTKKYLSAEDQTIEEQKDCGQLISSSPVEREDAGSNPVDPVSHVDSTESLQTFEMLALADKSRQANFRYQRVAIAKKMQQVVNRKVRKWLTEIVQLAAKYRDLTNLPRDDWIILLRNALSRLLLLFMAENNFQFAVAPSEMQKDGEDAMASVAPAEIPTNQSVEDIQRFIAKCQALKVDGKEYHCMRLITLFHSGCGHGLQRVALVEQINSGACKILQELVRVSRPDEKLRYGELLLHLHSLASVNSRMVQALFCITRDRTGGSYAHIDESEWLF